ncbi:hypothetical protein P4S64_22920 [Vibrio sp. M60_M31a]
MGSYVLSDYSTPEYVGGPVKIQTKQAATASPEYLASTLVLV